MKDVINELIEAIEAFFMSPVADDAIELLRQMSVECLTFIREVIFWVGGM